MESRTDSPDASVHDVVNVRTISDERLAELAVRVRPAIRVNKELWIIEEVDPRSIAFSWNPDPKWKCGRVTVADTIETLHTFAFHRFFKPTIAEVLAYVTDDHLRDGVYCFETDLITHDNWQETLSPCQQYHCATTTLYRASR